MDRQKISENDLLRWFNDDLSTGELESLRRDPESVPYQKLMDSMKGIVVPDLDAQASFAEIEDKIQKTDARNRKLRRNIIISAALLICAIIAGYSLWPRKLIITTKVGQPMAHLLPDGSAVNLNAKSRLSYDAETYLETRTLNLRGEAFFEVKKGSRFAVNTEHGTVTVLGTSFNVSTGDQLLMVSCKTGKVKVEFQNISEILEPGDRIRIENGEIRFKDQISMESISAWAGGESIFKSVPLSDVIYALENQFNLDIHIEKSLSQDIFTGSFIHSDQQKAMEMVFLPMGLDIEWDGSKRVKISRQ